MDPHKIIIRPVITETALELIEKENKITFIVLRKANRITIRRAVEVLYDVKVEKVNTLILPNGKKKAYVRLTPKHT